MKELILRIFLLTPWMFLIWLIAQGFSGEISGLLVFFLLFILIPGAVVINLITVIIFQGRAAIKIARDFQKQQGGGKNLESTNYSELPWWNPKKYR